MILSQKSAWFYPHFPTQQDRKVNFVIKTALKNIRQQVRAPGSLEKYQAPFLLFFHLTSTN